MSAHSANCRDDFVLHEARYWRVQPPFAPEGGSLLQKTALLAQCVAAAFLTVSGSAHCDVILCSTYLSQYLFSEQDYFDALMGGIEAACGVRPLAFLHSYECAGWGYALQFLVNHVGAREATVLIVDVDLADLEFFRSHPLIGRSGFGIAALHFTMSNAGRRVAVTAGPYPDSGFREFLHAIRTAHKRIGQIPTFLPFLRDDLSSTARRLVGEGCAGPNRCGEYGHCFGADPWIGLIEWADDKGVAEEQSILATSLAYNGYMTVCPVTVTPQTQLSIRTVDGAQRALQAFAASAGQMDGDGDHAPDRGHGIAALRA